MLKEFRDFVARGNVIDLAVAIVIGAAFGRIITSFVENIVMPPLGLLLGGVDFSNLFIDLSGQRPVSLADAQLRGLPVIAYGSFINEVVSFLIIAFVIFLVIRALKKFKREEAAVTTKDCPFCLSAVPIGASRCAACCVDLPAAA
jgi:large conductance mechanosensitive channel